MKRRPILALAVLVFFAGLQTRLGATFIWSTTAGTGDFNTPANWVGGIAPTSPDDLKFGSWTTPTPINLLSAFTANSIEFTSGYASYNFSTTNSSVLSLGSGGITVATGAPTVSFNSLLSLVLLNSQTWNVAGNLSVSGIVSGAQKVTKDGVGTLTLGGANTFSEGVELNAGNLLVGASSIKPGATITSGPLGTGDLKIMSSGVTLGVTGAATTLHNPVNLQSNSLTVAVTGANALDLAGVISGGGTVTKTGTGTLTLTGANTYPGVTTISAGTLSIGGGGTTGSVSGNIANSAALAFNRSDALTYSDVISGSGSLTKLGAGTLTLAGTNTYTGSTSINAGKLVIGADQNIGTAPGTATPGSLTFNGGILNTTAQFTLAANRGIALAGAGTIDTDASTILTYDGLIAGTGTLTKSGDGSLFLTGANTFSGGVDFFAGNLKLGVSSVLSGPIVSGPVGTGTLRVTASGNTLIATAAGLVLHNPVDLQSFALSASAANLNTLNLAGLITGTGSLTKDGDSTLTLTGANTYSGGTTVSLGTLSIGDGGTTGSISGNVVNNATLAFNRSDASTYAGVVSGTGAVTKLGAGTLTLTGANTYTGGTTLSAGSTLQVGAGGTVGSLTSDIANSGALVINRSDALAYAGILSGAGSFAKIGAGNLTLTGANTATGVSTISAGTVTIGSGGTTGSFAGNLVNNAALAFNRSDALTHSGLISGSGTLTKLGAGTLTLPVGNTYSGGTTISAGNVYLLNTFGSATGTGTVTIGGGLLSVGNGGTGGSVSGNVVNNAALAFNRSNDSTYAGIVSGTGTISKSGAGNLTLTGANTLTGVSTISVGTLTVGAGGTVGSIVGNVVNDASLVFSRSNAFTYAGVISGTGAVTQVGAGTLTLTGTNTYAGSTTINAGTLSIGDGGTTGSIAGDVLNSAALAFNRSDNVTYAGVISGNGAVTKQGAGKLTLTAQSTYTGNTTVTGGILEIFTANALPVTTLLSLASGTTLDVDANQTVAGFFSATGAGAAIGLAASKTFTIAMPTASTSTGFAGTVSGPGAFATSGAGSNIVNLTGTVSHTGGTVIGLGTSLVIGSGGSITGSINTFGTLGLANPGTQTFPSLISGTGGLSVTAGTNTLTANNSYTGPTTVATSKLFITGNNTGGGSVTLGSGGLFGGTGTFSGPLFVNSGGTVAPGASPGTLAVGATTFAGAGRFAFEINSVTGTAGTNWDLLSISGALTITATPGNPFIVDLTSLNLSNTAALVSNFNAANSYSWLFASASGGVTGFASNAFQINKGNFLNALGGGSFFVSNTGNDLFVNFTPVPEPSTYALMALGLGVIVLLARRRRL